MKSNLIIITAITLGLSGTITKAAPPATKNYFSCFPLRQSSEQPSAITPLNPNIQSEETGRFEKIKTVLCMYCCCPCLLMRSCCDQGTE